MIPAVPPPSRLAVWVVAGSLLPGAARCGAGSEAENQEKTMAGAPLKVVVETADSYRAGDAVPVKVVVTSISEDPVLVNARLLTNFEISEGELYFRIQDTQGKAYDFQALISPRDVNDQDFVLLDRGKSVEKSVDLRASYALKQPGSYQVAATYRNEYDWSSDGHKAWQGEVGSQPVTVRLQ